MPVIVRLAHLSLDGRYVSPASLIDSLTGAANLICAGGKVQRLLVQRSVLAGPRRPLKWVLLMPTHRLRDSLGRVRRAQSGNR